MIRIYNIVKIHDLINAHICFVNTSDDNKSAKILALETYRILLSSDKGLVDHGTVDLNTWKLSYANSTNNTETSKLITDLDEHFLHPNAFRRPQE